jgi:hypothetical protein
VRADSCGAIADTTAAIVAVLISFMLLHPVEGRRLFVMCGSWRCSSASESAATRLSSIATSRANGSWVMRQQDVAFRP